MDRNRGFSMKTRLNRISDNKDKWGENEPQKRMERSSLNGDLLTLPPTIASRIEEAL